jgi:7-keto-8-aminopelargonate synthetase-like enzyme
MVLLQAIIEVFTGSMKHLVAHGFTHCSWIGSMAISRHAFRSMANNGQRLLEKLLSRLPIPFLAQT